MQERPTSNERSNMSQLQPPIYSGSTTRQAIFTAVMFAILVGFIAWWFADRRERGRPYLPLLLFGGLIASLLEPTLDNLVLFAYPKNVFWPTIQGNGHYFPAYIPLGYSFYDGGLVYAFYRLLRRGLSARLIWTIAGAWVLVDIPLNAGGHWLHINGFYGPQVFDVLGYPLWWLGADVTLIMVGGAILYHLIPRLQGPRVLLLAVVPPVVQGSVVAIVWPAAWALRADVPDVVRWLCGVVTIMLAAGAVWAVTRIAATDRVQVQGAAPNGSAPAPGLGEPPFAAGALAPSAPVGAA
jgi:hypothetical protein